MKSYIDFHGAHGGDQFYPHLVKHTIRCTTLALYLVDIFLQHFCNKSKRKKKLKIKGIVSTPHSNVNFTHQKEHESCAFAAPNRPTSHNIQPEARIFEYLPAICIIHHKNYLLNIWIHGLIMHVPAMHSVQVVAPDALHLPLVFRKGRDALAKVRWFSHKN